jgi:hypothetical protein
MGIARAQCNEAREEVAPEIKRNEVALKKKTRAAFIARAQCSPGAAAARTKMFIAPLRHCRPKGIKWALHAHNAMKPVRRHPGSYPKLSRSVKEKNATGMHSLHARNEVQELQPKLLMAPLRHCRPKGVKWALHAHNEAREEGTVLHARSEKMRTSGCVSFPHSRLEPPLKKKAATKAHVSVLRACSEEKEVGCGASFPHSRLEPKHCFLSCTRAVEKIRTSGCACLPYSRLGHERVFLSCTRAATPFETSGFIKPLYQQKSRDPHQVSLHACNKDAA